MKSTADNKIVSLTHTVDMTMVLRDHTGRSFPVAEGDATVSMTLGMACATALHQSTGEASNDPRRRELDGGQKFARGMLAERIRDDRAAKLTAKEVTIICEVVAKLFTSAIVIRVFPLLDPNYKAPDLA